MTRSVFCTGQVGMALAFHHANSCAGIDAGGQSFHLKHIGAIDPSIADARQDQHSRPYFEIGDSDSLGAIFEQRGVRFVGACKKPLGRRMI